MERRVKKTNSGRNKAKFASVCAGAIAIAAVGLSSCNMKKKEPLPEPPAKIQPVRNSAENDIEPSEILRKLEGNENKTQEEIEIEQQKGLEAILNQNDSLVQKREDGLIGLAIPKGTEKTKDEIREMFAIESEKTDEEILDSIKNEQLDSIKNEQSRKFTEFFFENKLKDATQGEKESFARLLNALEDDAGCHFVGSFVMEMGTEFLNVLRFIAENTWDKDRVLPTMEAFKALMENPNLGRKALSEEFIKVFMTTVNYINGETPKMEFEDYANPNVLAGLFRNPNFTMRPFNAAEFSKTVNKLIEGLDGEDKYLMLLISEMAFANPNFKPGMLGEDFAEELYGIVDEYSQFQKSPVANLLRNLYMNPNFWHEEEFLEEGRKTAELAGLSGKEEELNFAYACRVLGPEKALEMHKRWGVTYFARYGKGVLEKAYDTMVSGYKEGNLTVLMYNIDDWSGAFYYDWKSTEPLQANPIIIREISTDKEFANAIESISEYYGKIGLMIIGGHGTPKTIGLGPSDGDKGKLDMSDKKLLEKLRPSFTEKPQIVLLACSSGGSPHSIASVISDALDAELWAPSRISKGIEEDIQMRYIRSLIGSYKSKELLKLDSEGRIEKLRLSGAGVKFIDGIKQ